MRELLEVVLGDAWRRESPWHGEEHWRCVAATGVELARALGPGADVPLVFLFGLLHDTRRLNEHVDPQHGARAAAFARELAERGSLRVGEARLAVLARALELHSDGLVDSDPTVAACWDADRLHLPRVGIEPDPARFSSGVARRPEWRERAEELRVEPPGWDEVLALVPASRSGPPIPQSYHVTDRLLAGEYPGSFDETVAAERLAAFAGVDVFVDLTDDGLRPYEPSLGAGVRRLSFPVRDFSVPDDELVVEILDAVDAELAAGRTVYVHCWGGIGRTGTVIGCWLARHGASGEEALARLAELHGATPGGGRRSPETDEQRALVRRWRVGD